MLRTADCSCGANDFVRATLAAELEIEFVFFFFLADALEDRGGDLCFFCFFVGVEISGVTPTETFGFFAFRFFTKCDEAVPASAQPLVEDTDE